MLKYWFLFKCCVFIFSVHTIIGYGEPTVNLGQTNILDGGPLIPIPGWYWRPYFNYYHANKFTNAQGDNLGGIASPHLNITSFILQFLYQSEKNIFKGNIGLNFFLPAVSSSHVEQNSLGITTSGSGLGDLILGVFLQWEPKTIIKNTEVTLTTRLALDTSYPTGKYNKHKSINPGNNIFFINPFWAATFHFTKDWAISWRLHYLWNSHNKKTHLQPGQAIHLNFDMEYQLFSKFWLGFVGYAFKQITDNKIDNIKVPNSRERVLGIGCGALYTTKKEWRFLSYLYFERLAQNRPQGTRFIIRLIKHF